MGDTYVRLSAEASAGWRFDGWSGDADCGDGTVKMSDARACTANFSPVQAPEYLLSIDVLGSGSVTSSPTGIALRKRLPGVVRRGHDRHAHDPGRWRLGLRLVVRRRRL